MLRPGINVGSLAPAASPHQFWTVRAGERGRCRRPFERIWRRPADQLFFPRRGAARHRHDQPALPAASKPDT